MFIHFAGVLHEAAVYSTVSMNIRLNLKGTALVNSTCAYSTDRWTERATGLVQVRKSITRVSWANVDEKGLKKSMA